MILSGSLSQQKNDSINPSEIKPIPLNTYNILEDNRNFDICNNNDNNEKYLIQTHSQAKTSGPKLESLWNKEEAGPKLETRKATCNTQTRPDQKSHGQVREEQD